MSATSRQIIQRTLAIGGSITVQLTSSLTGLDLRKQVKLMLIQHKQHKQPAGFEPPTSQHHTCPIFHYLQVKRERVTESCTKTDKQNGMNVNGAAAKIYVSRIPSKKLVEG